MIEILRQTVPPFRTDGAKGLVEGAEPTEADFQRFVRPAASLDGVSIFSRQNEAQLATGYLTILRGRYSALTRDGHVAARLEASMRENCSDWRAFGLSQPFNSTQQKAMQSQAELPHAFDYAPPEWLSGDEDARRSPSPAVGTDHASTWWLQHPAVADDSRRAS